MKSFAQVLIDKQIVSVMIEAGHSLSHVRLVITPDLKNKRGPSLGIPVTISGCILILQ